MKKTAKFTISMPQKDFQALEDFRIQSGETRSAFVLRAVRALRMRREDSGSLASGSASVMEESVPYGKKEFGIDIPDIQPLVDPAEFRARAIAAAGRFRSVEGDMSERHDDVLEEDFSDSPAGQRTIKKRKPRGKN